MQNFAKWYINLIIMIFKRIGLFFKIIGRAFVTLFTEKSSDIFPDYIKLQSIIKDFSMLDWVSLVVVLTINIVFILFLILLLYKLFRRYVRFTKNKIEIDALINEVGNLNQALLDANKERNAILSLKTNETFGINIEQQSQSQLDFNDDETSDNRFTKLIDVDNTYDLTVLKTNMTESDKLSLSELVEHFINFSASQLKLYYSKDIVRTFLASLSSSKLIILEGISGTGKTSLPYAFGKFISNDSKMISVQPSWTDRTEMLGYLNEFTKKYNEPDFLKTIYETTYRTDVNIIILDEMNLARVEYYFADFLSIMEVPNPAEWLIEIVPSQLSTDPVNLKKGKILLPQNVWFIGTANKDDSTFTITDKVYDRAHSIELNNRSIFKDAPYTNKINLSYEYLNNLFTEAVLDYPLSNQNLEKLEELDVFLTKNFKITFGNRILMQTRKFIPIYVAAGGTEVDGLDFIVARKVIRKFESINLAFLTNELDLLERKINSLFGRDNFKQTKEAVKNFRRQV